MAIINIQKKRGETQKYTLTFTEEISSANKALFIACILTLVSTFFYFPSFTFFYYMKFQMIHETRTMHVIPIKNNCCTFHYIIAYFFLNCRTWLVVKEHVVNVYALRPSSLHVSQYSDSLLHRTGTRNQIIIRNHSLYNSSLVLYNIHYIIYRSLIIMNNYKLQYNVVKLLNFQSQNVYSASLGFCSKFKIN